MLGKRGLSPVVATVLLVVITVVAVGIVASFAIPFVKKSLGNQDCFDVIDKLKFEDSSYVCYIDTATKRTGFSIKIDDPLIKGFKAVLYSGGSADPVEIFDDVDGSSLDPEIRMLGSTSSNLVLPQKGGVRTYVAYNAYEKIGLYPILESGVSCGESDVIDLNRCIDSGVISALQNT